MKNARLLIFLLCILGMVLLSACDKGDYKKAVEAEENGDYETAIELFTGLSKKNYEDSSSRLDTVKIKQIVGFLNSGEWDNVDCRRLDANDQIVADITGDPEFSIRCFYQKAQYFHENGRFEEALDELGQTRPRDDIPEGFDRQ